MKFIIQLAVKNILRAKRRTVLTFVILSFGIAMYIFFAGMMQGFDRTSFKNMIDADTGHFKVRSRTYDEDRPFIISNFIMDPAQIVQDVQALAVVEGVAPRLKILAEVDNMMDALPIVVIGIDKVQDAKVFTLSNFIYEGSLEPRGVVVGKNLAQDMEIGINDPVFLTFRNKDEGIVSLEYLVTGLMNTPDPTVNNGSVIVNLDEIQAALHTSGVSELAIKTKDFMKYKEYAPLIEKVLPQNVEAISWKTLSAGVAEITAMKSKFQNVYVLFIVIIAVVGIINTLLMSVYEKRQEIGTLKALGMKDNEVKQLFVTEGLIIGLVGGILGIIIGVAVNGIFMVRGMDIMKLMGDIGDMDIGYRIIGKVKSVFLPETLVIAFVVSVVTSVLASFYPANKTVKMEAAECLRSTQ